jgi:hypothetical protein
MSKLPLLPVTDLTSLDTREVWMALTEAHRHLAELKGLCESLPNQRRKTVRRSEIELFEFLNFLDVLRIFI